MVKGSKRPIDQSIIVCEHDNIGNTQKQTVIRTAGMAETLIRTIIRGGSTKDSDTSSVSGACAIVLVRDGQSAENLAIINAASLYTPEQDVIWFWNDKLPSGADANYTKSLDGDVKTMRKLRKNDTLVFITKTDSSTNGMSLNATVRTFFKQ